MAKFIVSITENQIIKTLEFMGKTFVNTWVEQPYGSKTIEKSFEDQIQEAFPDIEDNVLEQIEYLDSGDEDEIQDAILELSDYEREE